MGKGDYSASSVNSKSWAYLAYMSSVAGVPLHDDQCVVALVPQYSFMGCMEIPSHGQST